MASLITLVSVGEGGVSCRQSLSSSGERERKNRSINVWQQEADICLPDSLLTQPPLSLRSQISEYWSAIETKF